LKSSVHCMSEEDRQCTYERKVEARSRNHFYCGKAISITYYECVSVALVIQHAKRMHRIIFHLWPVRFYSIFPPYLINDATYGEKCH
jgi:hypothetical protein